MLKTEIDPPIDREAVVRRLAATYDDGRYTDAWEHVQEYQSYLEYTNRNPEASAYAVASALGIPRGRVRPWMDDNSAPDPVRAIEIADDRGWLDLCWAEPPFTGLNVIVAWIFSGGSITEQTKVPLLAVDEETHPVAITALNTIGLTDVRTTRVHEDNRAMELIPTTDASILGRLLVALGAPLGVKTSSPQLSLPGYLATAPQTIRLNFARTYVWNRGTLRADRPNTPVQIREKRSPQYRHEIQALFNSLVPDATRGKSATHRLSTEAALQLHQPPTLGGGVPK